MKHAHLRRALVLALVAALAQPIGTALAQPVISSEAYAKHDTIVPIITTVQEEPLCIDVTCEYLINKYGNLMLGLYYEDFEAAGFTLGDVVQVTLLDDTFVFPICEAYTEVPYGSAAVFKSYDSQKKVDWVALAMNSSSFVSDYDIATLATAEDGTAFWAMPEGVGDTIDISFEMVEKGGYEDIREALSLDYADERSDYPNLTDEQFANFREVTAGSIAKGVLYRSASPIDPHRNRNTYADAALRRAGVTHAIDLADSADSFATYDAYPTSYFASIDHLALNMTADFDSPNNSKKTVEAVRYIANNRGSFDVFCLEGKDRTGFVCAIIECLMGATADEIVQDYMITYDNYYGVKPGDKRYSIIAATNIETSLSTVFGIDSLEGHDLAACATDHLKANGLTDAELANAKSHLSQPVTRAKTYTIHRRVADAA